MSDTNFSSIGYVEETTFGTTPSANLQLLRNTGGNINPQRDTVTSGEIRSDLRSGEPVRTAEWSEGSVDVEWSYGTLDDLLEGMLFEAWASNVLVDGTTEKSYTFETQFEDPSISPDQFIIHKGCRLSQISMSLALGSIVTGSFGVLGATPSIAQASAGTGDTSETTTSPYNTVDMVTTLNEAGATETEAAIGSIVGVDLSLDRDLRRQHEIGSLNPVDIGTGRLLVTGSIQQYFEDDQLLDAWFAFGDRQLTIVLDDNGSTGGGNQLQIEIPKMRYVGEPAIDRPGPDSDAIVTVNFEAYADVGDAALIRFTRTAA